MKKLDEIGRHLPALLPKLTKPSLPQTLWGISEIKIDNKNGRLAQEVLPEASYIKLKATTFETYHRERIRLLDELVEWFGKRGQRCDHIPNKRAYRNYTANRGKGKGKVKRARTKEKQLPRAKAHGPQANAPTPRVKITYPLQLTHANTTSSPTATASILIGIPNARGMTTGTIS